MSLQIIFLNSRLKIFVFNLKKNKLYGESCFFSKISDSFVGADINKIFTEMLLKGTATQRNVIFCLSPTNNKFSDELITKQIWKITNRY